MTEDQTIVLEDVTVPSEELVFEALVKVQRADAEQLEKIREFLIKATQRFLRCISNYNQEEYREDPELLVERLLSLHEYNGGLLGLADALHRRIKSKEYIEKLQATGESGKPLTHDAREYHARNASADVEGIVRTLDEKQKTIQERIAVQRGKLFKR